MIARRTAGRPSDVPPCAADPAIRARLWQLALHINRRAARIARKRGQRRSRPITPTALALLDWLLWHAPRRDGGLWHSEASMAAMLDVHVRTIQHAKAALVRWGLIIVTHRRHSMPVPIRLGQGFRTVQHKGMRTSDAISFPNLKSQFPASPSREARSRQLAAIGRAFFESQVLRALNGRFLPAAIREKWREMDRELVAASNRTAAMG